MSGLRWGLHKFGMSPQVATMTPRSTAHTFTFHGAAQRDLYFRMVKAFLHDGTVA